MNSMWKRSFALLLSLVMVFGMVPVNAFAEETERSHSYETTVTDPTCTAVGYTTYTCACGDTYKADEVAATGHSFAEGICSVCGTEEHTHSYETVVTAPTCGDAGYTTYTCACGDSYTADEVAAAGHSYEEGVCTVCGAEEPAVEEQNEEAVCTSDENCEADTHNAECPYGPCTTEGCKLAKSHVELGVPCEGMSDYVADPAAVIGEQKFATLYEAVKVAQNGDTITLMKDSDLAFTDDPMYNNIYASVIDLNEKTLTIKEGDLRFDNITIKNGNIVVAPGSYGGTAIFLMYSKNLNLEEVTITAEGVSSTYLIGLEGSSNLNMSKSKIVVSSSSVGTLVASNGSNNTVTIENSEISAQNLGHGFLGGNHSVSGSKIQLTGMKSSGYYLRANQKLNVADKSEITVTGDAKYGQIYQTDLTAEMNVDESSTVTAKVVNAAHVAYIGETGYATLDAALKAAADGDTIELVWSEGKAPISMKGEVTGGKTVTITGKALVRWNGGWLFVGRSHGSAGGDGKLIFKDAELWTEGYTAGDKGIHVSGHEKNKAEKNNGTLELINSKIELDCLFNKGNMIISGGELDVAFGFNIAGRPANETDNGEDATATLTITDGAAVTIVNDKNMGIGCEGKGILNINNGGSLTATDYLNVCAKGTVNVDVGSKFTAGSIKGNGEIVIDAKDYVAGTPCPVDAKATNFNGTLRTINSKLVKAEIKDGRIVFIGAVAKIGEEGYYSLADALAAAKDGDTVELLSDVTGGCTVDKSITLKGNGKKLTGNLLITADTVFEGELTLVGGKVKVTNGATLTIPADAVVTGEGDVFFGAGNDADYYGLDNAATASGNIVVNGELSIQQMNANAGGKVTIAQGAKMTTAIICVENGDISGATAGEMNINGNVETQLFNVFGGATVNIGTTGKVRAEQAFTSSGLLDVVNVYGNATLNVSGKLETAQTEHTEGRHSNMNVEAGSVLNINGGELNHGGTLTNSGIINISGESTLNIATNSGEEIKLCDGAIIKDSTVGGDVFVAGNVTFRGTNTFNMLYDFGTLTDNYGTTAPMKWTVESGASVILLNKARYGLGYGDSVTVTGNIQDAKTARSSLTEADRSLFMHGLVAQENPGWNCNSSFSANNAYLVIGSNNSFGNKPGNYGGKYTFTINNSVLDASRITFYEAVSTTNFSISNSDVKIGTFMTRDADSEFTLTNTTLLSTTTTNVTDEGNYNAGKLNLDNTSLTYSAPLTNTGTVVLKNGSKLTAPSLANNGTITVDASGYQTGDEVIELTNATPSAEMVTVTGAVGASVEVVENKLVISVPVAKVGSEYFTTLTAALNAADNGDTVTLVQDILIEEKWNCWNSAKVTKAITIDGANHTIKFTGIVDDNGNDQAAFRFDNAATVKNLTLDMSEAKAAAFDRFVGISAGADLIVDNCTFLGNPAHKGTFAIIYGVRPTANIGEVVVSVTNSTFKDWGFGVRDNWNGQDIKTAEVSGNTFTNAAVDISAKETMTFTNNTVSGAGTNIINYSDPAELEVTATGNTLDKTKDNDIKRAAVIKAQPEFTAAVVAKIGNNTYGTLQAAVNAVQNNQTIILQTDIVDEKGEKNIEAVTVNNGKTFILDMNGKTAACTMQITSGKMTLKNGTIQNKNADASAIAISGGELSMSKMTVESAGTAVSVSGTAKAAITSGTYTAAGNAVALNVTGGTLVLTGGTYDMDCREYCKADYAPKNNGDGTWTVVKAGASAVINGKTEYFYSLAEAAEAAKAAAEAGKSVTEITRLRNNTDSSYDQPIEVRGVTIKGLGLNGTMEVVLGNDDVAKVYSDNTVKVTVGKAANDSSKYPSVEINTYESNGAKKTSQRVYVKDATVGITISRTTQDLYAAVEGEYMVDAGKNGIDSNDVYSWFENHTSEYKRGSAEGLKVTSTGFYNSCTEIKVDGVVIYTGNWKHDNIDVYPGSTVLVMSNKYLETLGNGDHIVTFTHKINGNTFTTSNTFKITAVYNANADKTNPKTGDEIALPMFVMFSTAAALAVLVMGKKKYF